MKFSKTIPVFRIFDEVKAKEFYIDFLGFKVEWEHRFEKELPLYMEIKKDDCVIHLTEHHGDCSPGSGLRIQITDIKEYQSLLIQKNYKFARPEVIGTEWDTFEMIILDPFGNKITFFCEAE